MAGWDGIAALSLACAICSPASFIRFQDANYPLVPPSYSSELIVRGEALPQPMSSAQARPLAQVCSTLDTVLADSAEQAEGLPGTCTKTKDRIFVQVRGDDQVFSSARFKLNTETFGQAQDLLELSRLVADFHIAMNWWAPEGFLATVATGAESACAFGVLVYEFSRERGDTPRFNLVVRIPDDNFELGENFSHGAPPCLRS